MQVNYGVSAGRARDPAESLNARMSTTLDPQERLWRSAVEALAADVIERLDADPSTAPEPYADRIAWAAQLLEREARRVGRRGQTEALESEKKYGIDPDKLYTAEEAAPHLGVKTARTVYRMGRRPGKRGLKATRTGPNGGVTRFRGSHLIEYLERAA